MIVVGLTGSIGMGKSEAGRVFASLGYPVFDADAEIHRLLDDKTVAAKIGAAFPDCASLGQLDRSCLAQLFEIDLEAVGRLEAILHPRVREATLQFLEAERVLGATLSVLEIPLLYETLADELCDAVVVVTASETIQHDRTLSRPGMTRARFEAIRARQLSDPVKRARADFVVDTGGSLQQLSRAIGEVVASLTAPAG